MTGESSCSRYDGGRMKLAAAFALVFACGKSAPEISPADKPHHHHEDRQQAQGSATAFALDVTIDGAHQTWTPATLARVPHLKGTNTNGESRDVWSLREVVTDLAGSGARIVSVTGDVTRSIGSAAWSDASKIPIVHSTRRGALKFRWADPDGTWREEDVVKDVAKLEIATK
jgi:hypothetical protein